MKVTGMTVIGCQAPPVVCAGLGGVLGTGCGGGERGGAGRLPESHRLQLLGPSGSGAAREAFPEVAAAPLGRRGVGARPGQNASVAS